MTLSFRLNSVLDQNLISIKKESDSAFSFNFSLKLYLRGKFGLSIGFKSKLILNLGFRPKLI